MSCISSYSGHFVGLLFLIVRTQRFSFILAPALLLISMSGYEAFVFLPLSTPVCGTRVFRLSVRPSVSLTSI